MKTLKYLVAICSIGALMACGSSQNNANMTTNSGTTSPNNNTSTSTRVDGRTDTETNLRTPAAINDAEEIYVKPAEEAQLKYPIGDPDQNNATYDLERSNRMYKDLGMTQDQINRYEAQNRSAQQNWINQNGNQPMNAIDRMKLQNTALQGILDQKQYTNYQTWEKANPYKN